MIKDWEISVVSARVPLVSAIYAACLSLLISIMWFTIAMNYLLNLHAEIIQIHFNHFHFKIPTTCIFNVKRPYMAQVSLGRSSGSGDAPVGSSCMQDYRLWWSPLHFVYFLGKHSYSFNDVSLLKCLLFQIYCMHTVYFLWTWSFYSILGSLICSTSVWWLHIFMILQYFLRSHIVVLALMEWSLGLNHFWINPIILDDKRKKKVVSGGEAVAMTKTL